MEVTLPVQAGMKNSWVSGTARVSDTAAEMVLVVGSHRQTLTPVTPGWERQSCYRGNRCNDENLRARGPKPLA